ncbi:flotillin family protein [Candidatus Frankia alpina]
MPFKVITGHGGFILPFFRKVRFLTLAMCEAKVADTCVTYQGISLNVRAVIAFKVGNDSESIVNAGQRFLSDQGQMAVLTGRIFSGHLRSIIGSMTVEEIIRDRQKLATEVLDGSKAEMARIGLTIDALQIQSIDDGKLGYIAAIAAPHNAAIQRQAQIAQAEANQAAAEAEQRSQRAQAEYARQTSIVQAQYRAEIDRAQAEAAQAGPLAKAQAEAAASHNRVALDRMLIDQLPEIVRQAASGLAGANVTVLNGAEGIGEIATGLVGQGVAIFEALRAGVRQPAHAPDGHDNGAGAEHPGIAAPRPIQET